MIPSRSAVPAPERFTETHWRDAICGAAIEIAQRSLGFAGATIADSRRDAIQSGMVGAHIPMVGKPSFELQLVAMRGSCEALATAVLGMDISDLPASVVGDAVGEIVNMLAGGVKRRLGNNGGDLELGLPVFVNGAVEPTDRFSMLAFPLRFGAIETVAVIIGPR